jgi:hypothetical protein
MTRLQAVILTAVFALAGCIDDGLDADPESTDNPACSPMMAQYYCDAPVEYVTLDVFDEKGPPCGAEKVYVIEGWGAFGVAQCEWVCLSACE